MLFLLSKWVQRNKAKCGAQHLEELAHHVRVWHLSLSYFYDVLPKLSWFKCSGLKHLPSLIIHQHAKEEEKHYAWDWEGPPVWLKGPTRAQLPEEDCVKLDFCIEETKINELDAGKILLSPSKAYMKGWYFHIQVQSDSRFAKTKGVVTLGMFLCKADDLVKEVLLDDVKDSSTRCKYELLYMDPASQTYKSSRGTLLKQFKDGQGHVFPDFFKSSGSSIKELASPFLVDGKLRLKAKILRVR